MKGSPRGISKNLEFWTDLAVSLSLGPSSLDDENDKAKHCACAQKTSNNHGKKQLKHETSFMQTSLALLGKARRTRLSCEF